MEKFRSFQDMIREFYLLLYLKNAAPRGYYTLEIHPSYLTKMHPLACLYAWLKRKLENKDLLEIFRLVS